VSPYAKSLLRGLLAERQGLDADRASGRQRVDGLVIVAGHGFVRRYAWAAYLIAMSGLGLLYLTLKVTPFHSGPVFNVLGFSSVVAIVAAIWMHRAARLPWALIAGGLTTFVAGDVLAYNYERLFGQQLPFPSIADGFYLATYPLLVAGTRLAYPKAQPGP
jgi:hypothetical protein